MHDYGYKWDGMLPLSKRTARTLNKLGPEIYRLDETDAEGVISNEEELEQHDGLFGIEKPEWKEFIESKEGIAYLYELMDNYSMNMADKMQKTADFIRSKSNEMFDLQEARNNMGGK